MRVVAKIAAPAEFDIETFVGTAFALTVAYTVFGTSTPIDWTGYTFTSKVKLDKSERTPISATITVTAPTPANGILVLASSDVPALQKGDYIYDIVGVVGGGLPRPVAEGRFIVKGLASA